MRPCSSIRGPNTAEPSSYPPGPDTTRVAHGPCGHACGWHGSCKGDRRQISKDSSHGSSAGSVPPHSTVSRSDRLATRGVRHAAEEGVRCCRRETDRRSCARIELVRRGTRASPPRPSGAQRPCFDGQRRAGHAKRQDGPGQRFGKNKAAAVLHLYMQIVYGVSFSPGFCAVTTPFCLGDTVVPAGAGLETARGSTALLPPSLTPTASKTP